MTTATFSSFVTGLLLSCNRSAVLRCSRDAGWRLTIRCPYLSQIEFCYPAVPRVEKQVSICHHEDQI